MIFNRFLENYFTIYQNVPNNALTDINLYITDDYIELSNIQLEESEDATEYEPYFVTNSTKITQSKNHTLTAIWTPNE